MTNKPYLFAFQESNLRLSGVIFLGDYHLRGQLNTDYPKEEKATINTGATMLIIKPKLMAKGTTPSPPDC